MIHLQVALQVAPIRTQQSGLMTASRVVLARCVRVYARVFVGFDDKVFVFMIGYLFL